MSEERVLGLICARGGSKGVPRKNIRPFAGRSLIGWAVNAARQAPSLHRLVLSTDDPEIAAAGRAAGAEVPFLRPPELARDDSPEWLVWRHALEAVGELEGRIPDILVNVPPTSPLREASDIEACLAGLRQSGADVAITVTPAQRNPFFNMVTRAPDGTAHLVIEPPPGVHRRQSAPPVYDITTVAYAARSGFVRSADGLFAGRVHAVVISADNSIDIDTEQDFAVAEFLMARRLAARDPRTV